MNPSKNRSGSDPAPVTLISGYRGLAESFLSAFSESGHRLSVLVRREEAVADLEKRFPGAFFFVGDLSSREVAASWVQTSLKRFGRIDCLVNNAAITGPGGRFHELDFDEFDRTLKTNFLAPVFLCQQVLSHFLQSGNGVILNLSGGGATTARPFFAAYGASKCALVRMTETLALEYPEFRFYSISPGMLKTSMMESVMKFGPEKIGREYETAKRCAEQGGEDPKKAAALALWLFENRPDHLNGKLISAIWDDYKAIPLDAEPAGWWTLRRVDEVCRKTLLGPGQ